MFTGIVEELGTVEAIVHRSGGARVRVRCRRVLEDASPGCSIATNGVCLTATELRPDSFSADVAPETLACSNLGALQPGALVNLERPLLPTTRLNGHIMQGHVDGTGEFLSLNKLSADAWWLQVRVPAPLCRYVAHKGSIALDGISLTIAAIEGDRVSVSIVPHTFQNTTLGAYRVGSPINIECDILAKHVERLLGALDLKPGLSIDRLRENGF